MTLIHNNLNLKYFWPCSSTGQKTGIFLLCMYSVPAMALQRPDGAPSLFPSHVGPVYSHALSSYALLQLHPGPLTSLLCQCIWVPLALFERELAPVDARGVGWCDIGAETRWDSRVLGGAKVVSADGCVDEREGQRVRYSRIMLENIRIPWYFVCWYFFYIAWSTIEEQTKN
jgi:hypothetical protein